MLEPNLHSQPAPVQFRPTFRNSPAVVGSGCNSLRYTQAYQRVEQVIQAGIPATQPSARAGILPRPGTKLRRHVSTDRGRRACAWCAGARELDLWPTSPLYAAGQKRPIHACAPERVHAADRESESLIRIRHHCSRDGLGLLSLLCPLDLLAFGTQNIARLGAGLAPTAVPPCHESASCTVFSIQSALARSEGARYAFVGCAACNLSDPYSPLSMSGLLNRTSCRGSQHWRRAPARPISPHSEYRLTV